MRYPVHVLAMGGLGDSIYQRPFVRLLAEKHGEVYVQTPWPELFEDINCLFSAGGRPMDVVKFTYPQGMGLRTQAKNMERQPEDRWANPPLKAQRIRPRYMLKAPGVSVLQELGASMGFPPRTRVALDLPDFGKPPVRYKRYAVVRPVTIRKEWANTARAAAPEYIAQATRILQVEGFRVVSVADVDGTQEWLEDPAPVADREFHAGELLPTELLALVQGAAVVVGGVGWIVPACMASGTPAVIVGGGQGGFNAPWVLGDRRVPTPHMRWLLPEPYCEHCRAHRHACNKRIPDFEARFRAALAEVAPAPEPEEVAA